ncbi:Transcription factor jumonji family protein / zinc finger family protein isoform 1 [Tripterygium wilfordii]|uniref:Transcription factor jumonji family protein / zinc finger family protein isoform 1 n=1 Tax=Tripterygium wilfordii TaxID=458696 RepID=A0A7J7DKR5_TRIWF|nr:putative lysine-specific demethylase JMJ16 [Tripterygium wilfordii]XP_038703574.1 putative lysine-specific demethylase JMJ16 [Tripterygium wilfordii]KAF5746960.1 Transcription factor jumonji family protein / zinc finger family protein isoform 1 [Tripterygium wilfordii]
MGTELMRVCVKGEKDDFPPVPPGFESVGSFTLKRVQESGKQISEDVVHCSESLSACESQSSSGQMDAEFNISDGGNTTRSLRHKPWINYARFHNSSEDESDSGKLNKNFTLRSRLPKGVIRGCPECSNCQKVTARWRPEDACMPELEDAPVFTPSEEEFEDTLKYIASIRPKAEPYGICRIVPPPSWKPPCALREKRIWEASTFFTRVQRVDKLQNRDSMRKRSREHTQMKRKRRRCLRVAVDCRTDAGSISGFTDDRPCEDERFGFEPGPEFTLETFQKYADDFKARYFSNDANATNARGNMNTSPESWEPSVETIEGEYWRIVEKATEEIEVLYGADLETGVFGSGFPKRGSQVVSASDERYIRSGWNLNKFPRLPGSVLSYEASDISGVLVPWLYIGMCLSSFCWHVEDHHLYSLNYLHWGAPKIWYGVPGSDALKLEEAMRRHLPDLFEEQPDLLHKLVTQLSPSILKSESVPVYRCIQNSGEFVLTFPRAYHSGFNCGFNCAEAVNVAPVDWLPHGQIAIELYREQGRRTSISHDKLLLGAARDAVRALWELNLLKNNTLDNLRWKDVCGKDGILAKVLKSRVGLEHTRRGFLCNSMKAVKMESDFDATSERECSVCQFDLHLSAVGCHCSPDRYVCLNHANQFCSCASGTKMFLFRYDICELNILVEALEGKLSAVYRWARLDLGLALSSYISNDTAQVGNISHPAEVAMLEDVRSKETINGFKNFQAGEISRDILRNFSTVSGKSILQHKMELPEAASPSEALSTLYGSFLENQLANLHSKVKEEGSALMDSNLESSIRQFSRDVLSSVAPVPEECREKPLAFGHNNIILLSDDEGDEIMKPVSENSKVNSLACHSESLERVETSDGKLSLCNYDKDPVITSPISDAVEMSQRDASSLSEAQRNICLSGSALVEDRTISESSPPNNSCHADSTSAEFPRNFQDRSIANAESKLKNVLPCDEGKSSNEDKHEKMGPNTCSNLVENTRAITGIPSCSQNHFDRYFRQKGPRIAKVVRRINCNVEPLEFGVVLSGKLWCNSQAIFPKGFRSRVKYMSVLDPANMSYYVSEILDAARDRPLFMVYLEDCPSEVFIHVSAGRCWEMVRERVNQEITKKHKLGRMELPPLQPPGSLDGFEMFGFSSPAIVQGIEALDRHRICMEYWDSRPYSRPPMQIPQNSQSMDNGGNLHRKCAEKNDDHREGSWRHMLPDGVDTVLKGLFKKANPEELYSLSRVLVDSRTSSDQDRVAQLLNEEIHSRHR